MCVCVCVCVCMYVSMYVSMYGCVYIYIYKETEVRAAKFFFLSRYAYKWTPCTSRLVPSRRASRGG